MNALEAYLKEHGLEETNAINALQDNGIISDLAVLACDVPAVDASVAVQFLMQQ